MTAYITKYALTKGVLAMDVDLCGSGMVKSHSLVPTYFQKEGRDWHRTVESALKRAEKMRSAKIASLLKQVEALKDLELSEPRTLEQ